MAVPVLAATGAIFSISDINGSSVGNVTSNGGAALTAKGLCWGTSANPTIADSHSEILGTDIGYFVSCCSSLIKNTLYYVRAYATNASGTGYGTQVSFTTLNEDSPVIKSVEVAVLSRDTSDPETTLPVIKSVEVGVLSRDTSDPETTLPIIKSVEVAVLSRDTSDPAPIYSSIKSLKFGYDKTSDAPLGVYPSIKSLKFSFFDILEAEDNCLFMFAGW